MATLAVQKPNGNSITEAAAASGGDDYSNDKDTFLLINNGNAAACTATIVATKTKLFVPGVGECTVVDIVAVIPAGAIAILHASNATYNNDANGRAAVTYSVTSLVTVAAIRLLRLG